MGFRTFALFLMKKKIFSSISSMSKQTTALQVYDDIKLHILPIFVEGDRNLWRFVEFVMVNSYALILIYP